MYINDAELAGTTRFYLIARFMLYPDSLYRGTTCTMNFGVHGQRMYLHGFERKDNKNTCSFLSNNHLFAR